MKWFKRFKLRLWHGLVVVLAALVIVGLIYVLALDRIVTSKFEGRRWTLPAQVYAEPLELYVGGALGVESLEHELVRLGYQGVANPERPGTFRRRGDRIDFVSRSFQFWDGAQVSQAVRTTFDANGIATLTDDRGTELPILRLDPLLIGSIFPTHGEDRVVVSPDETPPLLIAALKVVEDRKFDTHIGVDFTAILRAVWVNLRAGRVDQGASTLTQQLVRSYFLDNRQTLSRKLKEAVMAMLLEVHFDKQDLMNAYINEIWLGQDGNRAIHGYGLASQFYFGKPLSELDVHEIALLVAITRGPSYYNPRRHPERVKARRNMVLKLLEQFQVISPAAAKKAMAKPLGITHPSKAAGGYYPAFLDMVRRTLRRDYRDEDLTEAGLRVFATLQPFVQSKAEAALTTELKRLDKTQKGKHKAPLEGVVVVTSPQNGDVIALVGGREVGFDGYNRALDAKRSIGSLVKPVIYLAAIESGHYTAATVVTDGPVEVKLANGKVWKPQNIDQGFMGPVPLVKAISQSLNLATVNLGLDVGLPQVAREFQILGLERAPPQVPALLLGALDLSPVEVAQLFNAFANGGFRAPLRAVRAVVDAQGNALKSFGLEVEQVADSGAVYQVNRMLVQVMERGTGRAVRSYLPAELTVAGKTGTSSDYRDAWFAGFSGSHLAVVWIGYDNNESTKLTGSVSALPVWGRVMKSLGTTPWNTPPPENVDEVLVNYDTGFAVTPECGVNPVMIAVPKGTELAQSSGCTESVFDSIGERAQEWWRRIIR